MKRMSLKSKWLIRLQSDLYIDEIMFTSLNDQKCLSSRNTSKRPHLIENNTNVNKSNKIIAEVVFKYKLFADLVYNVYLIIRRI